MIGGIALVLKSLALWFYRRSVRTPTSQIYVSQFWENWFQSSCFLIDTPVLRPHYICIPLNSDISADIQFHKTERAKHDQVFHKFKAEGDTHTGGLLSRWVGLPCWLMPRLQSRLCVVFAPLSHRHSHNELVTTDKRPDLQLPIAYAAC